MDPQSQAFTPFAAHHNNATATAAATTTATAATATTAEIWRIQQEIARIQQVQQEHSDRITRVERRQDEDARMKSVWGNQSPFPSVLSGTPQQAPRDRFRDFDDEANNLMSSLHLDPEEEPRNSRSLGAASRANSVRFDETANQNHFAHSSRSSLEFPARNNIGLGGLQLNERSSSHKSDGRASSVHSMRSAASGRASSLNLDTIYLAGDPSPLNPPGMAPGLLFMGSVPAIVRCWMNTNFKHDALLYAAVCTGSFRSYLDVRLVHKLGFQDQIVIAEDGAARTVELRVFFPEAVPHPVSGRSSSPAPQLPTITVRFEVIERAGEGMEHDGNDGIRIFIGSDSLREHNADILFSSNTIALYDDDRNKLNIPLVRPEQEATFNSLKVINDLPSKKGLEVKEGELEQNREEVTSCVNGLGQQRPTSIDATNPPTQSSSRYRASSPFTTDAGGSGSLRHFGPIGSENGSHAPNRPSSSTRPSLSSINTHSESTDSEAPAAQNLTPLRSGSSPAIWSNWRRGGGEAASITPASPSSATTTMITGTAPAQSNPLDWAAKRKETGMKVLKPKSASRTVSSSTTGTTAPASATMPSPGEGKSRFFDHGSRRGSDSAGGATGTVTTSQSTAPGELLSRKEGQTTGSTATKTKSNPVGGASAFSWLNSGRGTSIGGQK